MNTILTINLTGSVLLFLYFLVKRLFGERLTRKDLYRILKVNVICFFVPLIFLGEIYRGIWLDIQLFLGRHASGTVQVTPKSPMFLQVEKGIDFSLGMKGKMVLLGGYLFVVAGIFAVGMIRDHCGKRQMREAIRRSGGGTDPCLEEIRREFGIRRKVEICYCEDVSMAAAVGTLWPIILFKEPENAQDKEMILRHELYHIKQLDILWQWLARLACCIHFYNPMVYVLAAELVRLREQCCDEQVVSNLDVESRGRYAHMLVKYSTRSEESSGAVGLMGGADDCREMKERVRLIMMNNEKKKMSRKLAVVLMVGVLFVSSLTALAYDDISWWEGDGTREKTLENGKICGGIIREGFVFTEGDFDECNYSILYDKEYIDAQGDIYPMFEQNNEGDQTKAFCIFHSYQNVTIVEHYVYTDGSCEVDYYDAVRCEKCGYTKSKTLTHVGYCDVCPHSYP